MILAIPVQPDAPTGREWARDELSQPIYHPHQDPVSWLFDKIFGFFDSLSGSAAGGQVVLWIIIGIVVVAAVIFILILGPMRRARLVDDGSLSLTQQSATARELRGLADAAYRAGDYPRTIILAFRALAQDGIERLLISPLPGLTAHEAALSLTRAFPHLSDGLMSNAVMFDEVAYNDRPASESDARDVLEFVAHVARARAEHGGEELVLTAADQAGAAVTVNDPRDPARAPAAGGAR